VHFLIARLFFIQLPGCGLRFFLVNQVNVSFHVKYYTADLASFIFVAQASGVTLIVDSPE
jgi:hypothetical protein